MILAVCIQMNRTLIAAGFAIILHDNKKRTIDFDVVKGEELQVIVGSRGKRVPAALADLCEEQLLELFETHQVSLDVGQYDTAAGE